jgi:hypothetical protein
LGLVAGALGPVNRAASSELKPCRDENLTQDSNMNPQFLPFLASALFGLIAWAAVTRRYIWPVLKLRSLREGAEPILYLHLFRYVGLAFIAPGAVSASLSPAWAYPAAYGDLGTAVLAGLTLLLGRGISLRVALWVFNLWGTVDLLRAAATGPLYDVPGYLQSTYFIPVFYVPLLLWTHMVVFALLLRKQVPPAMTRA